jgi:hypothetical protein
LTSDSPSWSNPTPSWQLPWLQHDLVPPLWSSPGKWATMEACYHWKLSWPSPLSASSRPFLNFKQPSLPWFHKSVLLRAARRWRSDHNWQPAQGGCCVTCQGQQPCMPSHHLTSPNLPGACSLLWWPASMSTPSASGQRPS